MSFYIIYEKKKFEISQKVKRVTPSPVVYSERHQMFVVGDIFDDYEKIYMSGWRNDPASLNNILGAKSVIYCDDGICQVFTDVNGIESLYYYHRDNTFIVSDDIWDIIRIVKPNYEDLNGDQLLANLIITNKNGDVGIKGLKRVMPNTSLYYDNNLDELQVVSEGDFRFTNKITDCAEAADNMDRILENSMKLIKDKMGDVTYGVGVSGGLDSRIIPHYAKMSGMKISAFNICIPKPHSFLLAQSVKNSKKIAKLYDIPFNVVKWSNDNLIAKIHDKEVKNWFYYGGNAMKYETRGLQKVDALLTGASGMIVGSELPTNIDGMSREELINAIYMEFMPTDAANLSTRIRRGIAHIFNLNGQQIKCVADKVVPAEVLTQVKSDISDYVDERLEQGKRNIEIYEDYFINVCGFTNRYGAFESLLGEKRSISIYIPFLLEEVLSWSPELLYGRKVLKELIRKKIPECAEIGSESFEMSINRGDSIWNRLLGIIIYLLRGNGTDIDNYYWYRSRGRKEFLNYIANNECKWFDKVFAQYGIEINKKLVYELPCRVLDHLWEFRMFLSILEKKEYLN